MDAFTALSLLNDARKLADLKYVTHEQLDEAYKIISDVLIQHERMITEKVHKPHAPLEIPVEGKNEKWN